MALETGTKLGPYEILSPLGAGGMGEVYRAKDTKLHREIAIKVLPADVASSPERLLRFEREATTVAALNHPNIVTIFGIEESGGHRFIAMELVEGETLDRMIAPGGMPLAKIFDIAIPLSDALAAAHDKGIVHRDLKPANVMVTKEGRVKVLDFGLAKLTVEGQGGSAPDDVTMSVPLTGRGVVMGTVPYMSPEQLNGEDLDHRTDLFSLGIMLYEMATGQRPFQGKTSASITSSILRDTPRPVQELNGVLPRHLGRIIERCLAKDPEQRLQSAKDIRNDLRALLKEVDSGSELSESQPVSIQTVVSPPPSSTSSTSVSGSSMSAPTRRGEFWIGVIAVIVAIGAGAWWLGRDGSVANKVAVVEETSQDSGIARGGSTATLSTEDSPRPSEQTAKARITLAVLPFKNLGSPDDEYFSDGISDEIRGRLAKVRRLGVISRSSAFQYKDTDKTNRQIGSDLGVDYLIDGTIRWDKRGGGAGRVRITPELIRISDDMSVWSQPYDRQLEDIFEVQSDIAAQVLKQLQITLLEPERRVIEVKPTENSDAYHAYLRGLVYMEQPDYSEEQYRLAIRRFERAVSLDPSFALAYAQLSTSHSAMHHFGYDSTENRAAKAKSAVDRAFELQPGLPESYVALGWYHYWCHRDYERALEAFHIAQKDLPNNSDISVGIGYIRRRQGQLEESIGYLKRGFESNPLSANLANDIAETYLILRKYPEAERWCNDSISLAPDQQVAFRYKAELYWLWHGDTDMARATLEDMLVKQTPDSIFTWFQQELLEREYQPALDRLESTPNESLADQFWFIPTARLAGLVHGLMGESERSRQAYDTARILLEEEAKKRPDDHRIRSSLGIVYAGLGRKEDAIREGKLGVDLFPVSKDAMIGPYREEDLAFIHTLVGEYDLALGKLEYLLSIPSKTMSVPMLRLDPRWDALRDHPRYKNLMRKHGFKPEPKPSSTAKPLSNKTTLAVLPFQNISNDPDTDYLSNEIPASIIDKLSGLSGLSVISRSGAFRFAPAKEDASSFGKNLGASVVLTGQLNARGTNLTIRVELVDVATNQQLWSKRYPRELSDIMAVETDITNNISEALRLQLTREEKTKLAKDDTVNPEAYRAYIEARFWWNRRSENGFDRAIRLFDHAISLDSQYARAYAGKADCYLMLALYYRPSEKLIPLAKQAIKTALHLDDSMAEAYASLGFLTAMAEHKWRKAEEAIQRGISLNPRYATLHHWLGVILFVQSRFDESLSALKRANEIEPNSLIIRAGLAKAIFYAGDVREALTHNEATREMAPEFFPARMDLATMLMKSSQPERAIPVLKELYASEGRIPMMADFLGVAYAQSGQITEARDELRTLTQLAKNDYVPALAFASIHASLRNVDEAFRWLDKSYKNRELGLSFLNLNQAFDVLHGDPRYDDLLRRIGLVPAANSVSTASEQKTKTMLAVLPFANLSGDPEQEYFSDGMTEEMITRLGRLRPELLGVIARTSAMRYKKTDKTIDQIGRELGVAYVVEGGVRRAGNSVRINAQLIQVSDQTQLWGDSYTRNLSDVFAVQEEVAEAIAESLAVKLLPQQQIAQSKAPTESAAAYDAYLLGRNYWAKRTPESLHTAIKHFKHAIELDPNYALAYCGLADAWSVMPYYVPGPYNKINAEAMKAAERALALNDSLAEAHVSMASVLADGGDLETANEHYQKAVAIDPNNATAHQWYGDTLSGQERYDQAAEEYEKAIALDPLSAVMHNEYGDGSVIARRFDKAIEQLNEALRLQSDLKVAYISLTWAYIGKEDHNAAANAFESFLRFTNRPTESITKFRRTYDASGLRAGILEWLDSLGNDFDSWGAGPARRAPFYAWCNEKDRAFESLDRAIGRGSPLLYRVAIYFPYDNLRGDPRYADLLKRIAAKNRTEEVQPQP